MPTNTILLKLKISKIIPSFRSCRSKDSSTLPINPFPAPFHSQSSINIKRHVSSAFGCGFRSTNSAEEKWHVVAKLYMDDSPPPSPRRKIYDSSASLFPKHIRRRFDRNRNMNRKAKPRLRISTSSESGLFSSEGGLEETDSTTTRERVKRKSLEIGSALFQGLIPCVVEGEVGESVAVVKRSENPYEDFRRSMMEVILEKKMFEERDLEKLVDCLLSLNSRDHHGVIVQVFYEIWEALFN